MIKHFMYAATVTCFLSSAFGSSSLDLQTIKEAHVKRFGSSKLSNKDFFALARREVNPSNLWIADKVKYTLSRIKNPENIKEYIRIANGTASTIYDGFQKSPLLVTTGAVSGAVIFGGVGYAASKLAKVAVDTAVEELINSSVGVPPLLTTAYKIYNSYEDIINVGSAAVSAVSGAYGGAFLGAYSALSSQEFKEAYSRGVQKGMSSTQVVEDSFSKVSVQQRSFSIKKIDRLPIKDLDEILDRI